jgi:hypothetical protein
MAINHDSAISLLRSIPDDSGFIHDAMDVLGFVCEFGAQSDGENRSIVFP